MEKDRFTFQDAVHMTRPASFAAVCKPVGAACNLVCTYCYYLDKGEPSGLRLSVMDDALLERFVRQHIEANAAPEVTFCWHGGEPLLAGIPFYRRALALQRRYGGGKTIRNTIQTNGTLVDDAWSRFFAGEGFLVGLSLDGPEEVHDAFRRTADGRSSFGGAMQALELFLRNGVAFNTLSVVSRRSEGRGAAIYAFLRDAGSRYMQFLPAADYVVKLSDAGRPAVMLPSAPGARPAPWSVSDEGYGRFLCEVFDAWVVADVGQRFVQLFDAVLAQWCGEQPGVCALCETCGEAPVVERNGDVYACDHYVWPVWRMGNLTQTSLAEMFGSEDRRRFALDKRNDLSGECLRCSYYVLCRGGCPGQRVQGRHLLCEGLRLFFEHSAPYMQGMRDLLVRRLSPAWIMPWARKRLERR